jgi:hypothetical protein
MKTFARLLGSLIATGILAACYDSTGPYNPPPPPTLEGAWAATVFTTTNAGGTIDRFAEGLRFNITVNPNGTTVGAITSPTGDLNFTGTWDTTQAVIRFHQENPIFLDQLPFEVLPNRLVGDAHIGVTDFHVVLVK